MLYKPAPIFLVHQSGIEKTPCVLTKRLFIAPNGFYNLRKRELLLCFNEKENFYPVMI